MRYKKYKLMFYNMAKQNTRIKNKRYQKGERNCNKFSSSVFYFTRLNIKKTLNKVQKGYEEFIKLVIKKSFNGLI